MNTIMAFILSLSLPLAVSACGGPGAEVTSPGTPSAEVRAVEQEPQWEEPLTMREFYDLPYDSQSAAQTLDLYLPEEGEGPFPLVVFIHGGGWFSGDKQDHQQDPWLTLPDQGYAVASVNYRLSGEAPHPAGIIDCKTALRYLKANAGTYHLDPDHIAVSGDSSGGHYALMLALTAGNPEFEDLSRGYEEQDASVQCAVVWYPATDLAQTMKDIREGRYTGFGADFAWENIERYAGFKVSDVSDERLTLASPIHYISTNMPPILLQHGNSDTICPIDQSRRFYQAALPVVGEDRIRLDVLEGTEHGDRAFETAENMALICEFLDAHLK